MEENKEIMLLLVGDSTWPMYVNAFYTAAKRRIDARLFDFGNFNSGQIRNNLFLRIENKLSFGLGIYLKNCELLNYVKKYNIKYVFLYSARIIGWKTVKKIKKMGVTVAIYCNDNPFSKYYPSYFWRNIKRGVKYCDITYSYRKSDIEKYKRIKARDVRLLRSYYNRDRNFVMESQFYTNIEVPRVVFLGHFENDERGEYLDALLDKEIKIGIRKTPEWIAYAKNKKNITIFQETVEHYNEILNRAEIALVFLSKINEDTYTRRCFEIAATGTMMLAPYNDDLTTLFVEDKEAVFYKNKEDFVKKVEYYLAHPDERKMIGMKGRERILRDGHEAENRINQVIDDMLNCKKE